MSWNSRKNIRRTHSTEVSHNANNSQRPEDEKLQGSDAISRAGYLFQGDESSNEVTFEDSHEKQEDLFFAKERDQYLKRRSRGVLIQS